MVFSPEGIGLHPMHTETPEIFASLTPRFDSACEQLKQFSRDAAQLHEALAVRDDASRAVFNALSRILAFSDQIELILALMREDVRAIEELSNGSIDALWNEQFGEYFHQWLRTPRGANSKVN